MRHYAAIEVCRHALPIAMFLVLGVAAAWKHISTQSSCSYKALLVDEG
jgi:hypothetical protein